MEGYIFLAILFIVLILDNRFWTGPKDKQANEQIAKRLNGRGL